jgi:hypothetical protein
MIRRLLSSALFAATLGCTTLRPVARPQEFIPSRRPDRIWVTRADNSKIVLDGPRLLGDTLVGWFRGDYQEILLLETRMITVRQPAGRRTALLVGTLAVVGVALIAVLASSGDLPYMPTPEDPATAIFALP